jgi:hypothetical protein
MPSWIVGAVRAGLQIVWTFVIGAAAERGFTLPAEAPAWLDEAILGVGLAAFVGLVQWLETRPPTTFLGKLARRIAALLMLGVRKPVYPQPPTPSLAEEAAVRRPWNDPATR